MRRREFITLLGGAAAAWPAAARAQQAGRERRIGVLSGTYSENDPVWQALVAVFIEALQQLGWTDKRNIRINLRWAESNPEKIQVFAKELVDLQCDVILGEGNAVITALQKNTKNIPIIFTRVSDPIGRGFVATLARPGRNITGFTNYEASIGGKWLDLLKEISPQLTRVALIFNPVTSPHIAAGYYLRSAEDAGRRLTVRTLVTPVKDVVELERTVGEFAQEPNGSLIVLPDAFTSAHADLIVALAARFGLPAVYPFADFPTRGGLLYYGIRPRDQYEKAASYVDRILRGIKPADLPVEAPTKFELAVNLKTAKAIGLTISEAFLLRADRVIE